MEIIAVVVGYLLGVTPFILPKLIEYIRQGKLNKMEAEQESEREEIYDEWLNGEKIANIERDDKYKITQEDIYNEYITGKVVKGD